VDVSALILSLVGALSEQALLYFEAGQQARRSIIDALIASNSSQRRAMPACGYGSS
jgi:hypothetical protein